METNIVIDPAQIPASFARCFQQDCPKAATCLRYIAGQYIPAETIEGRAVYPTARTGDQCRFYKKPRKVRLAWGFKKIFYDVKERDVRELRRRLYAYLGGTTNYYRYNKGGLYKLTPGQQQDFANIFSSFGYTSPIVFNHYSEEYDFR